ncbi:SDR family oxidoreductase [Streptomyces griseiscabiei]|uniref:SDR family oxidoreductase n=1 Tax=Streptomyces griseiscabiei TaxID=2993540 RepID=A0ABU4LFN3_9ACTN|nr:SDR family oxidoreductase [Streptomyces griseiscabiei]MBZ3900411.1 SDR family oxidoreductase [Streptomyces griseiscabiei]MDX2914579.1 SDR family oxidoreductase [Streptomyces griseiscabiei]
MNKDVVVVIGVGGMGQAIARRIGSGRQVLLADFNESTLDGAADLLRGEGHHVATQVVDVSDADSVHVLADVAAGLGSVTHVAHTAGLSAVQASTWMILRVDLLGAALVLDAFQRVVAPGAAAVVIASMAGYMAFGIPADHERALAVTPANDLLSLPFLAPDVVGVPGAAYVLAKRANALRVQAAAGTWGERGAWVNSISPGIISTPMGREELDGQNGQQMRDMVNMSALRRFGTPDDIAAAAAFLLGPQAAFISGTDLLVDGGVVAALRTSA